MFQGHGLRRQGTRHLHSRLAEVEIHLSSSTYRLDDQRDSESEAISRKSIHSYSPLEESPPSMVSTPNSSRLSSTNECDTPIIYQIFISSCLDFLKRTFRIKLYLSSTIRQYESGWNMFQDFIWVSNISNIFLSIFFLLLHGFLKIKSFSGCH